MYGKTATSMAARKTLRMHIEKKLLQAAAMPATALMRQYGASPAGLPGEAGSATAATNPSACGWYRLSSIRSPAF